MQGGLALAAGSQRRGKQLYKAAPAVTLGDEVAPATARIQFRPVTPMLLFKKKFLPAIRSGEKTLTIRLWPWRRMRVGQRSYIPGVGSIRVEDVEQIELGELTDDDAIPDGFDTADALRSEIATIYGEKLAAGYQAFRVVFRVLEDAATNDAS